MDIVSRSFICVLAVLYSMVTVCARGQSVKSSTKFYDFLLGCLYSHLVAKYVSTGMIMYVISTTIAATATLTVNRRGPINTADSAGGTK